jgi:thiol-disulfide isomerase/thioredoxin
MFGLIFGFLLGCTPAEDSDKVAEETAAAASPITWDECSYRIGEHICNLSLPDSNMDYFELYDYYGRPIVIDLSAEWCAPCLASGPHAELFMDQWATEDLLWITVLLENTDREDPTAVDLAEWVDAMGNVNSVVLAGSRDLVDATGEHGFPLTSWPTFILINKDMVIYHGWSGWSEDYLNQKIAEMLFNGG